MNRFFTAYSGAPHACTRLVRVMRVFACAVAGLGLVQVGRAAPLPTRDIAIEISPTWGPQALLLTAEQGTDSAGAAVTVSRLDFLISRVALRREDGTWLESKDWFACVRCDQGKHTSLLEGVPSKKFTAIRFNVGVDPVANASDPNTRAPDHPLNPLVNGLHWGWAGGYVFLALEGRYQKRDGAFAGYSYHLANNASLMQVELPLTLDAISARTVRLVFDVERVFRGKNPIAIAKDGNSTHSREGDALAVALKQNVESAFRVASITSDRYQNLAQAADPVPAHKTTPFPLKISARLPQVSVPADNRPSVEGVALGERLFHETLLSKNNQQSCASCHDRSAAFADVGKRFSIGAEGQIGARNAPPLFNLLWQQEFFWDGRAKGLRHQALMPIQDAHEMNESLGRVLAKLSSGESYAEQFDKVFGGRAITSERVGLALEQYMHTLISQDSKFDRAARGEVKLTAQEQHGLQLFVTENDPARGLKGADCFHCHGGNLFTNGQFMNNGLALAAADLGRMAVTKSAADRGKFKTPSLRNVAVTAPYMHDGRFATLEDVIEHYDHGVQRTETLDPNLAKHPATGLGLTAEDKAALVAFLKSLTDDDFIGSRPNTALAATKNP